MKKTEKYKPVTEAKSQMEVVRATQITHKITKD